MLIEEKEYSFATHPIRFSERDGVTVDDCFQAQEDQSEPGGDLCVRLFEFAGNVPASFAERFPRLMVCAVAVAVLLAAMTAEIDCLRGSGYYWP